MTVKNTFINAFCYLIVALSFSTTLRAQTLSTSPEYSAGMAAYVNGDFETAKQHWLVAAQSQQYAKAMFNLGLLHERQNIVGASDTRAEQWFEQAGIAGYAPADYHLSLRLLARGDTSAANRLLRRAADAGFVLAQERLKKPVPASKSIKKVDAKRSSVATTKATQALSPNVAAISNEQDAQTKTIPSSESKQQSRYKREPWLLKQPSHYWTIQMLAFTDEAKVKLFIEQNNLYDNAAYFAEGNDELVVYKLVYGAYATKQLADQARSNLSANLKGQGPWLRPINALQKLIRQR